MAFLKYTLLRLAVFALVFALTFQMLGGLIATIVGLIISFAVGYLFFPQLRIEAGEQAAHRMGARRRKSTSEQADNAAEDELADQFHQDDQEER